MQCPNCETVNRDGAKFCDECGFPLKDGGAWSAASDDSNAIASGSSDEASAGNDAQGEAGVDGQTGASPATGERQFAHDPEREIAASPEDQILEEGEDTIEPTVATDDQDTAVIPELPEEDARADAALAEDATVAIPADLAGFDRHVDDYGERVVDPGYRAPEANYRDGGTMQMPRIEGDEAPKSKDFRASSTTKQKKTGKFVAIAVAAVVAVVAIAAFGTYQAQIWGGKVVPDVTGMTEADAMSVLGESGFEVKVEQVKSDDTEGLVLIMDPSANSRLDEGSEVIIHIATTRTIPEIKGKTKDEAAKLLAEAGYENVKYKEKSSDKTKGTVLSVDPKEGERAKSTAEITVTVAKPYTVPNMAGMAVDEAIAAIEKAELGYEVVYYDTDEYPEGTVVSTEPAADTEVKKGSYVVLNVAQARGSKLEEIASEQIGAGATIDKGGKSYSVESLDSVAYIGNNTVSYTATAREFVYVFGSQVTNPSTESISGTVVFDENDEIVSIS